MVLKDKWRNVFKAYDIRGRVPEELNEEMAYSIGISYVELFRPNWWE
ncbi:hypothetical protein N752_30170 [Desulforamulus aquiferis]|nr:hypothetical protein N752_30170 [Desulforamulus aquiferis]